ncbi:hypothetical protein Agub_g7912 [Astrephomene gubernaculifera]|uniref:Sodium/calcium exchanger membrane region domain-containing protein n=1 Tax=Astrephomene gubernaculifera TaxID=47775 RepID=A0AAD3HMS7_9CHLO|nr:hypothetical protein Agub_g7912 [Astrephomene gubernaculifera]
MADGLMALGRSSAGVERAQPPLGRTNSKGRGGSGGGGGCGRLDQFKVEARAFLLESWKLNLLLFALPFAFIARFADWGDGATFTLSCLALVPLAERLGFVTEQLAMYTSDTLGGLLNATFGNATEMIISAFALIQARHGSTATYLRVVQLSLLGSVVSNLLLVMGTAFIAGGFRNKMQTFNQTGINVNAGMLVLATFAVLLPSLLDATHTEVKGGNRSELALSRFECIFMFLCYCVFLFFQLKTHSDLFDESGGASDPPTAATTTTTRTPAIGPSAPASGGGGLGSFPPSPPLLGSSGYIGGGSGRATGVGNGGFGASLNNPGGAGESDLEAAGGGGGSGGGGVGGGLLRSCSIDGREVTIGGRFASGAVAVGGRNLEMVEKRTGSGRSTGKAADVERLPLVTADRSTGPGDHDEDDDEGRSPSSHGGEEEEEAPVLSRTGCFLWLAGVTVFISFLSEFVTDAIKGASHSLGIPMPFLTTILLPIVGNAAEHASAIVFAYRNRIEIALGVAVGSSTQVSMMVVPFCVLLAWTMGLPLDLDFTSFEAFVLFGCVLLAVLVVQDGHANYLKGILLLLTYFFISAGFWCHKDTYLEGSMGGGEGAAAAGAPPPPSPTQN